MTLIVSIGLLIIYVLMKPLADGLLDTSNWIAKALAPENGDIEFSESAMKYGQAALMDGWLSNVPFFTYAIFILSIVTAFLYHWWAAIIIYFVSIVLAVIAKLFWVRSVSYYLLLFYQKMTNRLADYKGTAD